MNVFSFLTDAAQKWADAPAVIDEEGQCSFSELLAMAMNLINELERQNIPQGTAVGMVAKNGRRFVAGLFALLGHGSVVMPIPPEVKPSELAAIGDQVPLSHAIVVDPSSPVALGAVDLRPLSQGFAIAALSQPVKVAPHVPNAAVIRFSSGTTSQAKGVILSHESIEERTRAGALGLGVAPGDTVCWVLPMAHHFIVSVLLYVRSGVTIAIAPNTLAQSVINTTNRTAATLLYASPLVIRLLTADSSAATMTSLKRVISTASGLPKDLSDLFRDRFGIRVSQAYGIIEVGLPLINLDGDAADSVGKAMPGYEAAILSETGALLESGKVGRLGVRGPGMFDGYLSPPQKREQILERGWFMTGDLASMSQEGEITVRGREKSVINTAGNKVFPEEIEHVLVQCSGVQGARVVGVQHPLLGELVTAEIVPASKDLDLESVRQYCYTHLSPYKVPKLFNLVESLPMTPTGKLVRH